MLAIAQGGLTHGLHGHLKWLSKQLLTDLSDDDILVREAAIYGLTKNAAVAATGPLTITGTNATVIPNGTLFVRNDGVQYSTNGGTISGGQFVATVTALFGTSNNGAAGDALAGTLLTIVSPITGINAVATVSGGGITDGADLESVDSLRARLILRKQTPPKGGSPGDYVQWALQVSGTTRAWEYPNFYGPGTVAVLFVRDGDISIIPDAGAIATMQAYLDSKAPVTAEVTALAPIADVTPFTIHLVPSTTDTEAAVTAELNALLLAHARPGDASDATLGTILLSQIDDAVGIAAGVTDYTVTVPAANVTVAPLHMVTLGVITWA